MMTNQELGTYISDLQACVDLRRSGAYMDALHATLTLAVNHPDESSVWHTLGQVYTELGDFDLALESTETALRLIRRLPTFDGKEEQFGMICLGYAYAAMRHGKFKEAWPYWEAGRFESSWSPYWEGAKVAFANSFLLNVTGAKVKSLLVQMEGGYGDVFMFMRWLPMLHKWASADPEIKIGLTIFPALADFCKWDQLGVDQVYVIDQDNIEFGKWEYCTSIMSLPALFQMSDWKDVPPAAMPAPIPFWLRDRMKINRIGFCWRAEENSSPQRTKSLPFEVAENVADRISTQYPRMAVFSLSPEKKDLYNDSSFAQPGIIYEPDQMTTWQDTATYLSSMDFIITVDTAVAHLAGIIGVPTLVLLPASSCWRWGLHPRTHGPWYGPRLTYYRQTIPLKWHAHQIVDAFMKRIEQ